MMVHDKEKEVIIHANLKNNNNVGKKITVMEKNILST